MFSNTTMWIDNVEGLSENYRVILVDVPMDAGKTIPKKLFKTEHDYSLWLNNLLNALELERVVLVGGSNGGWIGLNFAAEHPERLNSLIVSSPPPFLARPKMPPNAMKMIWVGLTKGKSEAIDILMRDMFSPSNEPDKTFMEMTALNIKSVRRSNCGWRIPKKVYRSIESKVHFIAGEHEITLNLSKLDVAVKNDFKNADLTVLPNAGHAVSIEKPAEFNALIAKFANE